MPFPIVRLTNPTSTYCWANSTIVGLVWLMKELDMQPPEMMDTGEENNQFLTIFAEWFNSNGSVPINPRNGLIALFRQYSPHDEGRINHILTRQQETEMFMSSIQNGLDKAVGEPFFQFLNPNIVRRKVIGGCDVCGTDERPDDSSAPEKLGVLDLRMEIQKPNVESIESLIPMTLSNNYDAPCPHIRNHPIDESEFLKASL